MKRAPVLFAGFLSLAAILIGASHNDSTLASSNDFPAFSIQAQSALVSGDVDCDEGVDAVDALLILRAVAGLAPVASCISAGDVNCDDVKDAVDALLVLRHVVAFPVDFMEGCPAIGTQVSTPPLKIEVDDSLQPLVAELPGVNGGPLRPVAAASSGDGTQADFVENELYVVTDDDSELAAFLGRWEGELLLSIDPSQSGTADLEPIHLVRVDVTAADPSRLVADLRSTDDTNGGDLTVSSEAGLELLAAAAKENATGVLTGVNWLLYPTQFTDRSTTEAPTDVGGSALYSSDAFDLPYMDLGSAQDIGVGEAWRALEVTNRLGNQVKFMVADAGFSPNADFPATLTFVPPSAVGIPNSWPSAGGSVPPWHGSDVVMAGMGTPDNAFGAAGPAGPVVGEAVLVQSPSPDVFSFINYIFDSLPTVVAEWPRILNISAGSYVPAALCAALGCQILDTVTTVLRGGGMLIFAAAGNESLDVDEKDCMTIFADICWEESRDIPCELNFVICVGGLGINSNSVSSGSNWGTDQASPNSVDIFAPYNVWVGPDPGLPPGTPANVAQLVPGTSFSSPFAAGIAALILAADPSLSADEVASILLDTAHEFSFDPLVSRWVDAYAAVVEALGNAPPDISINQPLNGSSHSRGVFVSFDATASDPEDGTPAVTWTSSRDGVIGTGTQFFDRELSFGTHTITATATDSGGFSFSDSVTITIVNDPPVVTITNPANGAAFFQSQPINLAGTSFDQNNPPSFTLSDAQVSWRLDGSLTPFATGHAAIITGGTLALGPHTITFRGSDGTSTDSDTITITVSPDPADLPPNVLITSPANGATFTANLYDSVRGQWYRQIFLIGSANDPEDGALTGASLIWSTRINGGPPEALGTGSPTDGRLYAPVCGANNHHQITLTATDSASNTGTYTINVTVNLIC